MKADLTVALTVEKLNSTGIYGTLKQGCIHNMQNTVPSSRHKRRNFMCAFLDVGGLSVNIPRFTNTKESAVQKRDDLLNSPAVRHSPPIASQSPKAISPIDGPKFFAGVTRVDGKDGSALANKSLSDSATQKFKDLLNVPNDALPKAVSPAKDRKFFAGVTRADGKDGSAFTNKSLSFV
ncbi:hypothetical protein EV702DRAFT_1048351 [Suillus placidus]|uniref:Uncharacterized protein n=1 Tax=Suillus placidus TaxID=48579 RepID=A0A9P6ZNL7_9AGAM|nr:hypothetical protein EV702DRAFT_1048351 [Suillus placidus]